MEWVELGVSALDPDANDRSRPAAMGEGSSCQERIDLKAFTGKGTRPELRHLEAELDRLEQHMAQLIEASKKVPGGQIYLALHRKTRTGYTFLRWREYGGDKRHLSWQTARALYARFQPRTAAWYAQLSERAMHANDQHLRLRKEARAIQRRLLTTKRAIFARPIPQ